MAIDGQRCIRRAVDCKDFASDRASTTQFAPEQEVRPMRGQDGGEMHWSHLVMSISINPTNQHVFISGACDAFAKLWDIRTGKAVQTFRSQATNRILLRCNSSLMARLLVLVLMMLPAVYFLPFPLPPPPISSAIPLPQLPISSVSPVYVCHCS